MLRDRLKQVKRQVYIKAMNKIKQAPDVREPCVAGDCMESPASDPMYPYISES